MPTVTINGKQVTVPKGTPIIRAAALAGVSIPHFCYHPAMSAPANCRMCLVEVEKARKLEPSCYLKCTDGMVVHTESAKVKAARKAVMEFILVNHPVDCPICDQAGECKLQDYYMSYDAKPSRVRTQKVGKAKAHVLGPHVVYDGERCILCTRCVRFCDEVTGTSELTTVQRGDHSEIRTFPGRELDNPYSMCVTDICPVGALTTRDFRFKTRVWLLASTDSICTGCSRGCNVHLEHFQGELKRYRPRFNPEVNEYWMCDAGRLSYREVNLGRSLEIAIDGERGLQWPRAARSAASRLKDATASGGVAFVASMQASTEALVAAREFAERVLGGATVYLSGKGDGDSDAFLIRADKNPNRAGARLAFGDDVEKQTAYRLLDDLEAGRIRTLYMMRAELPFDAEGRRRFVAALEKLDLFVLQGPHGLDLEAAADVFLPSTTHAEHDGTYVNEQGIPQATWAGLAPQGQSLPDWDIFARIARAAGVPLSHDSFESWRDSVSTAFAAE
jgi:NADH-quinone oxidoreductase subunit G